MNRFRGHSRLRVAELNDQLYVRGEGRGIKYDAQVLGLGSCVNGIFIHAQKYVYMGEKVQLSFR